MPGYHLKFSITKMGHIYLTLASLKLSSFSDTAVVFQYQKHTFWHHPLIQLMMMFYKFLKNILNLLFIPILSDIILFRFSLLLDYYNSYTCPVSLPPEFISQNPIYYIVLLYLISKNSITLSTSIVLLEEAIMSPYSMLYQDWSSLVFFLGKGLFT